MKFMQFAIMAFTIGGCAALLGVARPVLTELNQQCAWRTPSTDVAWIKQFCRISDASTPELEQLVEAKVSAQRAGVLKGGDEL